MYGLYKDPKGEKVFMAHVSEKHSNSVTARSQMGTTTGKITEVHCDTQTAPEAHKNKSEIEVGYLVALCLNPVKMFHILTRLYR